MDLKVVVECEASGYEKVVDKDIEDFNEFFQTLGNGPIVRAEKAIIKTYLAWKLGLVKDGTNRGEPKPPTVP